MNEKTLRKEVVEVCHLLYKKGFIAAYDGNVSALINHDRILATPSGVCKGFITEEDLIVINSRGEKISGPGKPTSENVLHTLAYQLRNDLGAVVHAHAPMAIAFSIAGISLTEAILPEIVFTIGSIPTAPYATPTTAEVAESVRALLPKHDAIILAKHGTLTVGKSPLDAYFKVEKIEHTAHVIYCARGLGNVSRLADEEIQKLQQISPKMGMKTPVLINHDPKVCGENDENLVRRITALVMKELSENK
ncbi:MAG TPA: class II aldolase family protein [Spirochaetia bacterium]|nr:class II aldolase family protein [Spirochaetia bacterium]